MDGQPKKFMFCFDFCFFFFLKHSFIYCQWTSKELSLNPNNISNDCKRMNGHVKKKVFFSFFYYYYHHYHHFFPILQFVDLFVVVIVVYYFTFHFDLTWMIIIYLYWVYSVCQMNCEKKNKTQKRIYKKKPEVNL